MLAGSTGFVGWLARRALVGSLVAAAGVTLAWAGPPDDPRADRARPTAPAVAEAGAERERDALAFVRVHHPELASVVEALKPANPGEYHKAIGELATESRTLADLRARNPERYAVHLDVWKAKSRVELAAAEYANAPSPDRQARLKAAIAAKLDADIRRHRFDLDQAEAAARKARDAAHRLESNRDTLIEARLRALQPKKPGKPKKPDVKVAAPAPPNPLPHPQPQPSGKPSR